MIRRASISLRLATWFAGILFLGWTLFGAGMRLDLERVLTAGRYQTLSRRADRLAELLRKLQAEPPETRERKYWDFANATGDGLTEVYHSDGTRAFDSPSDDARNFPWPGPSESEQFVKVRYDGQQFRVLARTLSIGNNSYFVCLGAPLSGNLALLDRFTFGLLLALPVLLILSAVSGYFVCRKALAPVDRITASVRSISTLNLSRRLPVPTTRDELQRLAETCNEMLGRMDSAMVKIRQFTSNASHELRSPLSFARTTAEVALLNPSIDIDSKMAFEEIVEECAKAGQVLEDLLTLARSDSERASRNFLPVEMAAIVRDVCQRARVLSEARDQHLDLSCTNTEGVFVQAEEAILGRLLWILLDNAIKYTPASGHIAVTLDRRGSQILLAVEDDGIGIPESDLPHVFERFYRSSNSREVAEGSGLGLAIAKWIAEIHHAEMTIHKPRDVGTRIEVVFPVCPEEVLAEALVSFAGR